jgi:hypothetical protein
MPSVKRRSSVVPVSHGVHESNGNANGSPQHHGISPLSGIALASGGPTSFDPPTASLFPSADTTHGGEKGRLWRRRRKRWQRRLRIGYGRWQRLLLQVFLLLLLAVFCGFVVRVFVFRNSSSVSSTETDALPSIPFQTNFPDAPVCHNLSPDDVSYTLVTQLSQDRLWMMEHHCQRWGPSHPMSIAVFTNQTVAEVRSQLVALGCAPEQLASVQTLPSTAAAVSDYPVNVLRNLAFRAVTTTHIVYVDVDFWPSADLHATLSGARIRHALAQNERTALVIPAFQLQRQCRAWKECPDQNVPVMPTHKAALERLSRNRQAFPFDPTNVGGHGSTKYRAWIKSQPDGVLLEIPCVLSNRYEPYLVVRYCDVLPPFQEAFSGYGKNKMTWVLQLLHTGYRLFQIPQSFVTHYPHLDSPSRMAWNGGRGGAPLPKPRAADGAPNRIRGNGDSAAGTVDWLRYRRGRVDHVFVQFREWLRTMVTDARVVPYCESAEDDDGRLWIDHDTDTPPVRKRLNPNELVGDAGLPRTSR